MMVAVTLPWFCIPKRAGYSQSIFVQSFARSRFFQEISVTKFLTPLLASHVVPQHLVGFAQVQEKISQRSIPCVCVQVQEKISTIESSIP